MADRRGVLVDHNDRQILLTQLEDMRSEIQDLLDVTQTEFHEKTMRAENYINVVDPTGCIVDEVDSA
jgi:hypothetical protein